VNTIAQVDDDELDLHGKFWVKSRSFSKSRSGTTTEVTLIPPFTLMF
jgi:hypothetical protein